jgi:hypothetical protein
MSLIHRWILKISEAFGVRLIWVATAIFDGAFLILWVAVQFLVSHYVKMMDLEGRDKLVVIIFQWVLFPASTLAPIAIWIYQDIRVMIIRAQRMIDEEGNKK